MTLPANKTKRVRYDGLETYLELQLDATSTTIQFERALTADGGKTIAPLADNEYMVLSILTANYVLKEIIYLVEYDPDASPKVGTITRGEEGTTAVTHSSGRKVVHSPTAVDYQILADHATDSDAHEPLIRRIAQEIEDAGMEYHTGSPSPDPNNPHPMYLKKGEVVIDPGDTLVVEAGAVLHIKEGATLLVDGTINITSIGTLVINGHRIVVSDSEPASPPADTVWIRTFGS